MLASSPLPVRSPGSTHYGREWEALYTSAGHFEVGAERFYASPINCCPRYLATGCHLGLRTVSPNDGLIPDHEQSCSVNLTRASSTNPHRVIDIVTPCCNEHQFKNVVQPTAWTARAQAGPLQREIDQLILSLLINTPHKIMRQSPSAAFKHPPTTAVHKRHQFARTPRAAETTPHRLTACTLGGTSGAAPCPTS
jgi:hypothetical protein